MSGLTRTNGVLSVGLTSHPLPLMYTYSMLLDVTTESNIRPSKQKLRGTCNKDTTSVCYVVVKIKFVKNATCTDSLYKLWLSG